MPELACGSGTASIEQSGAMELDRGSGGVKVRGAAVIAELADRDERSGGKVRKDVCRASAGRKAR